MKNLFFAFIIILISFSYSFSQDIITKNSGDDIKTKILEVNAEEVKYKRHDNLEGPTFTIRKSEILMIRYENGTKDIFNKTTPSENISFAKEPVVPMNDMIAQGKADAELNYKGRNSGAGWTGVTSVALSPVLGLIPAIACSSSEPNDDNLNYRNQELMNNPAYNKAYTDKAHKIKKKKVWTGFGIGSGAWLLLILLL